MLGYAVSLFLAMTWQTQRGNTEGLYHVKVMAAFSRHWYNRLASERRGGTQRTEMAGEQAGLRRLQSSPGYLHVGHVPSKWTWQMPHTSSSGISQRHVATAFHCLILTFMLGRPLRVQETGSVS